MTTGGAKSLDETQDAPQTPARKIINDPAAPLRSLVGKAPDEESGCSAL